MTKSAKLRLSVVIPVHNAQASLEELWRRLAAALDPLCDAWEAVFVDDGSTDRSWPILARLAQADQRVKAFRLMRNHGQHNALLLGIRAAAHPAVLTMDDDLQHPPEEIPKLLAEFAKGPDVVYGVFPVERQGFWRTAASRITKLALGSALGGAETVQMSALRVFRTDLRQAFAGYRGAMPNIDVLLSWGASRYACACVRHNPRNTGASGYTPGKLAVHALNMVTGFTVFPLRLASLCGLALSLAGLGLLAAAAWGVAFFDNAGPGWAFMAALVCVLSGAQLLALGVLGEYVARMHARLLDKPAYTVAESLNVKEHHTR